MAPSYPVDWRGSQSLQPPSTLWAGGTQSFGHQVPCGLVGLSPLRPQVPCGRAELSTFAPPGTLETGGTQYFWPPRYPVDWWDSVLSAPTFSPQVPYGLVGLSPFAHQVTLGLEHMAGHAYQEIYICVCILVYPGGFQTEVKSAQNVKNVDLYSYLYYLSLL